MRWQDIILSIGSLAFSIALIPTIRAYEKPAISTSLMTAFFLGTFVVVDMTLNLPFAAVTNVLAVILWTVLAVQVLRRNSGSKG